MKKGTLFLLFFIVLFGGGIVVLSFLGGGTQDFVLSQRVEEQVTIPIILEVEGITYQAKVALYSNVYDVMVKVRETSGLSFDGTDFAGLGFFLEEVNGLRQNPKLGKYWIYYINGQKAQVGISAYIVKSHDIISFKYENEE